MEEVMASSKYNWMIEIGSIHREMERFLDHYTGSKPPSIQFVKTAWEPAVDMYQTVNELVIIVELAGANEEDMQILVDHTNLIIRGRRNAPGARSRRSYYQKEIKCSFFERILTMPVEVDTRKISVTYLKGMLQITAPKSRRKSHGNTLITILDGRSMRDGS